LAYVIRAAGKPELAESIVTRITSGSTDNLETRRLLATAVVPLCNEDQLGALLTWTCDLTRGLSAKGRAELLRKFAEHAIPTGAVETLNAFAHAPNTLDDLELRSAIFQVAGKWKAAPLEDILVASTKAGRSNLPPVDAIQALGRIGTETGTELVKKMASDPETPVAWRVAAVQTLAESNLPQAAQAAITLLSQQQGTPHGEEALVSVVERKGGIPELQRALKNVELPADAARAAIRAIRSLPGTEKLGEQLRASGKLEDATWKLTPELLVDLSAEVQEKGDAARGEVVYRRAELQCIKCHAIGSAGGLVGPNLVSIGGSAQVDYLIESLLAPNAKQKEGFQTKVVLTDAGKVIQGLIQSETEDAIRLRLADDSLQTLTKDSIESISDGQSLMPTGVMDGLTRSELVDLVRFLSELGRTPPYVLSTEPIVRAWQTLEYSGEANHRFNRTSIDAVVESDPIFKWLATTSKVDGTLPIQELPTFKQHRETPPLSFLKAEFEVKREGKTRFEIGATEGLTVWLDDRPTPSLPADGIELPVGVHQLILAIDRNKVSALGPVLIRLP
jgi:putative heme-binding domain-containing protein